MPIVGHPIDPWDEAPYVIGTEDDGPLAACAHVGHLDAVVKATIAAKHLGPASHVPDVLVAGVSAEGDEWMKTWGQNATEILVHDVKRKKWFLLHRAWIRGVGVNNFEVSVDSGEEVAAPLSYTGPN